jgi:hypothetical protein
MKNNKRTTVDSSYSKLKSFELDRKPFPACYTSVEAKCESKHRLRHRVTNLSIVGLITYMSERVYGLEDAS